MRLKNRISYFYETVESVFTEKVERGFPSKGSGIQDLPPTSFQKVPGTGVSKFMSRRVTGWTKRSVWA